MLGKPDHLKGHLANSMAPANLNAALQHIRGHLLHADTQPYGIRMVGLAHAIKTHNKS
jgi:hypothetical protein